MLLKTSNQVFTREQILDRVWGFDKEVNENNIEIYVHNLRKKLKETDVKIDTIRGVGYTLANVRMFKASNVKLHYLIYVDPHCISLHLYFSRILCSMELGLSGEVYLQKIAEEIENREQNGADIKEESSASTAVHEKLGYDYIIWDSEHNVADMKVENNSLIMHGYEMDLDAGNNGEFRIFDVDTDQYRVYNIYNKQGKDYTVWGFFRSLTPNNR